MHLCVTAPWHVYAPRCYRTFSAGRVSRDENGAVTVAEALRVITSGAFRLVTSRNTRCALTTQTQHKLWSPLGSRGAPWRHKLWSPPGTHGAPWRHKHSSNFGHNSEHAVRPDDTNFGHLSEHAVRPGVQNTSTQTFTNICKSLNNPSCSYIILSNHYSLISWIYINCPKMSLNIHFAIHVISQYLCPIFFLNNKQQQKKYFYLFESNRIKL